MQAIIWFVGLFAAAVALALFAGDNAASLTVFWPPYRVDLSLNLALLLLVTLLALLFVTVRAVSGLFELPHQARRWRHEQYARATTALMLDARLQLLAGRAGRAKVAAEAVLTRLPETAARRTDLSDPADALVGDPWLESLRLLARLTAAEAALALGETGPHNQHLNAALATAEAVPDMPVLSEAALLNAARWSLEAQQPEAALERLRQLPTGAQRRLLARRLQVQAWQQQFGVPPEQALASLQTLQRRGLLADAELAGGLRGCADVESLQRLWSALDDSTRARPALALLVAQRLLELGAEPGAVRLCLEPLWQVFEQQPDSLGAHEQQRLLQLLERSLSLPQAHGGSGHAEPLAWLQRIEALRQARPDDEPLLALAERASLQRKLW